MIYTLYKTTNIINGKFYIGIHKTSDPNDAYLGSGKILKLAILKYGQHNFKKEILATFDTLEDARKAENAIVNEEFVHSEQNYNIGIGGGLGGSDLNGFTFSGHTHTEKARQKIGEANKFKVLTDKGRQAIIRNNTENEDRKRKISETLTGVQKSDEYKKNHSMVMKEYYSKNPNKTGIGIPKQRIKCPYCGKKGSPNNMRRWHFDNCKLK